MHNIQCDVCRKSLAVAQHTYTKMENGKPKEFNFCSDSHFLQWAKTQYQDITFDDEGDPVVSKDAEKERKDNIILSIQRIQSDCHGQSIDNGNFSSKKVSDGDMFANMHRELSEAYAATKDATRGDAGVIMAEVVYNVLDYAGFKGMNTGANLYQLMDKKRRK